MKAATPTYAKLGDDLGQDGCGVVGDATVGGWLCLSLCGGHWCVLFFVVLVNYRPMRGGYPWCTTTETQRGGFFLIVQLVHGGVLRLALSDADPLRGRDRVHRFHHGKQDLDAFSCQGDHSDVVSLALMSFYVRRIVVNAHGI